MSPNNPPPEGLVKFIQEHDHGVIIEDSMYPRSWNVAWELWRSEWIEDYNSDFIAACDKVGIPHNVEALIRHHRGNAALTTALELKASAQYAHYCTFTDSDEPAWYSAADCDCDAEPGDDLRRFVTNWERNV